MKYIGALILIGCGSLLAFSAEAAVTLTGKVLDQKTKEIVDGRVTVFYDNDIIEEFSGNTERGQFMVSLEEEGWYIISIVATGYLETTDTLWVVNENAVALNKEYYISPIEVGLTVTLI
jgi:hypothetical protein